MNLGTLIRDIIGLLIIIGAVISLFFTIKNPEAFEVLRVLAGIVVGYYFGAKQLPIAAARN